MPIALKITWWIALALIAMGIGPVVIAMVGGHVSQTLGMMGYLGIVTLPLALVGVVMLPALALWTLIVWLRG